MTTLLPWDAEAAKEIHARCLYPAVRVRTPKALGSGTILYAESVPAGGYDGYVLTNHHVVENLIKVDKRWSTLLKREVPMDVLGTPYVETFTYAYTSRDIGSTTYQAEIACYDANEDLALLKVHSPHAFEHAAYLLPEDKINELVAFLPVWNVGCGLGQKPVITVGFLSAFGCEIDNKDYFLITAPSIFGNCIIGCSLISMANGTVKTIETIVPGDTVWSLGYAGLSQNTVLEKIESGVKEIYTVKTRTRTLQASGNHPVLTVHSMKTWDNHITNIAIWKQVLELQEGDVIAVLSSLPSREHTEGFNFAKEIGQFSNQSDFMRFLGFYLGDGYMSHRPASNYTVSLAIYDQSLFHRYTKIVNELFGLKPAQYCEPNILQVYSKELIELLERIGFGGKSTEKTIPDWVMTAPREMQEAFLQGYLESDGYIDKFGSWVFEANNENLIRRLRMMCIHMGLNISNTFLRMRESCLINGRVCEPNAPSVSFQVYPNYTKQRSTYIQGNIDALPNTVEWERIRSIEHNAPMMTYDIKLDATHTFFADGVLVHNSGGATFTWQGELIGVPARISITPLGFSADVVTHMGYSITVARIYQFLREQIFDFVFDKNKTSAECAEQRRIKRERDERRRAGEESIS